MPDPAGARPRRKRIVLCLGPYCNEGERAEPLYERLQAELGDPGPAFMSHQPVTWETANCLSMCECGPNLILYPEDIAYNALDVETLERLIQDHIKPYSSGENLDDGSKK
jgi:(2Fe-2S) ferredoxin